MRKSPKAKKHIYLYFKLYGGGYTIHNFQLKVNKSGYRVYSLLYHLYSNVQNVF
jgi:hypothetical protein